MTAYTTITNAWGGNYGSAGFFGSNDAGSWAGSYCEVKNRQHRYKKYWLYFANSIYDNLNTIGLDHKRFEGLYQYTRGIYNPTRRLIEFWQSNLLLDGLTLTDGLDPVVYPAWDKLMSDSSYSQNRTILALYGTLMGDAPIRVIDDPDRRLVRLEFVNPHDVISLQTRGSFVTAYELEIPYIIGDKRLTAVEKCRRLESGLVEFSTFIDGKPAGLDGKPAVYTTDWGFVPMVWVQHINAGLPFGLSHLWGITPKLDGAADLISKVVDQVRKTVDPTWFAAGLSAPRETDQAQSKTGRNDNRIIYGGANSVGVEFKPLTANLDLAASIEAYRELIREIEFDLPELTLDAMRMSGTLSARALELIRSPIKQKVIDRRAGYLAGITRSAQMAMTIGGMAGYAGYEGINGDSYEAGRLELKTVEQGVFASSPYDQAEIKQAQSTADSTFWSAAAAAKGEGIPLESYLDYAEVAQDKRDILIAGYNKEESEAAGQTTQTNGATRENDQPATMPADNPTEED